MHNQDRIALVSELALQESTMSIATPVELICWLGAFFYHSMAHALILAHVFIDEPTYNAVLLYSLFKPVHTPC